jgi:transposase
MEAIINLKNHHTIQELKTLYRTEKDARLARRIHGVYLAAKGLSCTQIMTITGAARRTIQQWVHKYNQHRIDGLKDKPRPGQPTKLLRRDEPRFCKRIDAGPTKKDGVSVLNGPAIRRILEREFGVLYSTQGLYDLLHRLGYSRLCPRPQHEKASLQLQQEYKKTLPGCWIKSDQPIRARK